MKKIIKRIGRGLHNVTIPMVLMAVLMLVLTTPALLMNRTGDYNYLWLYSLHFLALLYAAGDSL